MYLVLVPLWSTCLWVCDCVFSEQSSNSYTTKELKSNSSPDLSPPPGPVTLFTAASSKANKQAADGDVAGKTEAQQRAEGEDDEEEQWGPFTTSSCLCFWSNRKWTETVEEQQQEILCKFNNTQRHTRVHFLSSWEWEQISILTSVHYTPVSSVDRGWCPSRGQDALTPTWTQTSWALPVS